MSVKEQRKTKTKTDTKDTFHQGNKDTQRVNKLLNDYYNRTQ